MSDVEGAPREVELLLATTDERERMIEGSPPTRSRSASGDSTLRSAWSNPDLSGGDLADRLRPTGVDRRPPERDRSRGETQPSRAPLCLAGGLMELRREAPVKEAGGRREWQPGRFEMCWESKFVADERGVSGSEPLIREHSVKGLDSMPTSRLRLRVEGPRGQYMHLGRLAPIMVET